MMRYFLCHAGDQAYEAARQALDAAWGHPNAETKTETCISPAFVAPRDSQGRIVLAANEEFCSFPAAADMIVMMLGGGAVSEITQGEYFAAVATPPA